MQFVQKQNTAEFNSTYAKEQEAKHLANENSETDAKVFSKTSFGQHDSEFKDA